MIWTAWNNSEHHITGAGYGFKIDIADRDQYFDRTWESVTVILPAQPSDIQVTVNTNKASFWNQTCRELINKEIGKWLINNQYAPWPLHTPPKFEVQPVGNRQFRVMQLINP